MTAERIGMTVTDLYDRAVQQGGERIAVTDGERAFSYRDLGDGALRLSAAFRGLGLGHGDRVAFLMVNCAEYLFCEYAVARIGATRVPLAVMLGADDHVYMMNFARCRALVYHAQLTARVLAMLPELETVEHFIRVGEGDIMPLPEGHVSLASLLEAAPDDMPAEAIDAEEIAGIYFTGGTTGRPKGVMLSHRAWVHTCYVEMLDFEIGWHEVFIYTTPMTHAAGCLLLPVLLRQGRCVLLERFAPETFLEAAARERATASLVVPTIIYALLDYPERGRYDHSSLQNILYGAAPMAPERMREALAAFGPIFTQFFGQTEAPMALTALPRAAHVVADPGRELEVLASAGWPTFPTRLRLVDASGRDVPPGEPGEIVVQAPNMMSGYLDNPEVTADAIRDGWLYTGDIARCDAVGLVSIVDRKKDVIIRSGFNVYPREVEDVLFEHPAVRQAAVVGVPHDKWGEEVRAVVVLREGHSVEERELIEFVKKRKGSIAAPTSIEFHGAIPLTNLGKVDKKAIRQAYWAGRERQV
jgi:fatty-acyl-CoA synthase